MSRLLLPPSDPGFIRFACAESEGQQLAALRPKGLRLRDIELQMLSRSHALVLVSATRLLTHPVRGANEHFTHLVLGAEVRYIASLA